MLDHIQQQINQYKAEMDAYQPNGADTAESFRIRYLGTKGVVKSLMGEMKQVSAEQRKEAGLLLNDYKLFAEARYATLKEGAGTGPQQDVPELDLSLPGDPVPVGTRHPISLVRNRIIDVFHRLGFAVADGPE